MKTLLTFLAVCILASAYSQKPVNELECPDCNIGCMCKLYYNDHLNDTEKRKKIKDNWNDFFGEDLGNLHDYQAGANIVTIKFDGLGCIYPEHNPQLQNIKNDFLGRSERDYRNFYKHSFYNLYNLQQQGKSNSKIDAFIAAEGINNAFTTFKRAPRRTIRAKYDIEYFEFINTWNNKHVPGKIGEIDAKIEAGKFKKVVFFIHGYNVPYSLAIFQGKVVLDEILQADEGLKAQDILLVNVYWPSGNRKRDLFTESDCDYTNRETPRTAIAFTYYSNRAYLSAVFLRRIIRDMTCTVPVDIITHSHGSTLATSALINTTSKLQPGSLSDSIDSLMRREAFPDKQINVFLNAPSIPGVATFTDLEGTPEQLKYRFFVGYDENDIVLKKQKLKIAGHTVGAVSPSQYLSSTTLGCNKNSEIYSVVAMLKEKRLDHLFKAGINSKQTEHDFFCYVKQKEFDDNLKLFLRGNFR